MGFVHSRTASGLWWHEFGSIPTWPTLAAMDVCLNQETWCQWNWILAQPLRLGPSEKVHPFKDLVVSSRKDLNGVQETPRQFTPNLEIISKFLFLIPINHRRPQEPPKYHRSPDDYPAGYAHLNARCWRWLWDTMGPNNSRPHCGDCWCWNILFWGIQFWRIVASNFEVDLAKARRDFSYAAEVSVRAFFLSLVDGGKRNHPECWLKLFLRHFISQVRAWLRATRVEMKTLSSACGSNSCSGHSQHCPNWMECLKAFPWPLLQRIKFLHQGRNVPWAKTMSRFWMAQ